MVSVLKRSTMGDSHLANQRKLNNYCGTDNSPRRGRVGNVAEVLARRPARESTSTEQCTSRKTRRPLVSISGSDRADHL